MKTYRDVLRPPQAVEDTVSHEGGKVFTADDWSRLTRFLVLGSESGTFYVNARDFTKQNVEVLDRLLESNPIQVIAEIEAISQSGRAVKNEPAIFALAKAAAHPDMVVRAQALNALPTVCRTGTHLLHFMGYLKLLRKSSRMLRTALGNWFNQKSADDIAYQAVKYKSRDGWKLADVLRLARPNPVTPQHAAVYRYLTKGETTPDAPRIIAGETALRMAMTDAELTDKVDFARAVIIENRLPREAIPTELLNDVRIWDALLDDMPMTAMIRNLGKMTAVGLFGDGRKADEVARRLVDGERLRKARIHPLSILNALAVYEQGHGDKGSLKWAAHKDILHALDKAFYLAFGNVPSTGARIVLALDVSSSMTSGRVAGMALSPRTVSAAMALVTASREPRTEFVAYSHQLVPIDIRPSMRLDEVVRIIDDLPFGGTYCQLPIQYALMQKASVDAFVSYTDNETADMYGMRSYGYMGEAPPLPFQETLREYRSQVNPKARSIVVAMTATNVSLNAPDDPLALDVVGFDTTAPGVISDFIAGKL